VDEALAGYTAAAAPAGGREADLGRIAVGMRADLTAVDDIRGEDADTWSADRVRLTMVDGAVVHHAV